MLVSGDAGNDSFELSAGDDHTLFGGSGDDSFNISVGEFHFIDGGEGRDSATYASRDTPVSVSLSGSRLRGESTLEEVEDITLTAFDDEFEFSPSSRNDDFVIDGGDGIDTVSGNTFENINLSTGSYEAVFSSAIGAILNFENFSSIKLYSNSSPIASFNSFIRSSTCP